MAFSRRRMVAAGCTLAAAAAVPAAVVSLSKGSSGGRFRAAAAGELTAKEASWWEAAGDGRVQCTLCPRGCRVSDGQRGYCGVRENRGGTYYTLIYGRPCTYHNDPVEKKPLFHYLPGTKAFSVATAGCNIECVFCQNWNISQALPEELTAFDLPPEKVVEAAKAAGSAMIAHTYNEPTVTYEYMIDCARKGREAGIPAVMISNGFIREGPMRELSKVLGAVKIDLKAFTEKFYSETCHGRLGPVLDTLKVLKDEGIWFEIVVLLVTGLNDSAEEIKKMTGWVVSELSPDVPVHFSRYFPTYKLRLPQTPVATLERAWETAKSEGCNYVYIGNISLPGKADTVCPGCGEVLVKRLGFLVRSNRIADGKCPKCGREIPGVWKAADAFERGIIA